MTYEEFEKDMNVLLAFEQEVETWQEKLQQLMPESNIIIDFGANLSQRFIEKLHDTFPDTAQSEWIYYYLYDCDKGKDPREVSWENEVVILDNLQKLYYIISGNKV
jgi:hypothetical protein